MLIELIKQMKIAWVLLLIFMILTGLIYPAMVTGIAQVLFPWKANGSIIERDGKAVGSLLIGQLFISPMYFWGRPSATPHFPYNAEASSGSNLGPFNRNFLTTVRDRVFYLRQSDPLQQMVIPVDLVTASGSGLDPDISPLAAFYQVPRVAKMRQLSSEVLQKLIQDSITDRSFWILGEPRVNILQLNLALDRLAINKGQ